MSLIKSEFNAASTKVLFAASVGIALGASPIPFISIGHLVRPLHDEFGWNRQQVMTAVTIFAFAVTLLSPLFGWLVDKLGVRKVANGSLTLFSLTWMSITLTKGNLSIFYLMWLLIGILGGASIPISWTRAVNGWFVKNRGLALAIALSGTGVANLIINAVLPYLIQSYSWRTGVIALGLSTLFIGVPIALLLFREPKTEERPAPSSSDAGVHVGASVREALREPRFWIIIFSIMLIALAYGGLYSNFVPLLQDKGFDGKVAGAFAGLIGLSLIGGRLLAGWLIDRFWAPLVALPMLLMPIIACWLLSADQVSGSVAAVCAVMLGVAGGAETDLIAYLAARYYGLKNYGKIYGILYMPFGMMTAISAPLYGRVFDSYGTYNPALLVAGICFMIGALLLLQIGKYPDLNLKYAIDKKD
jgi:MFS transporter, OFA family, oxalate/formate antiporter